MAALGVLDPGPSRGQAPPANAPPAATAPAVAATGADLRPVLDAMGLTPRRQGGRPTCSVFTMTSALEFALAKRMGHTPRMSVEFLNWAACQACGRVQDGGFFSDLWHGFETSGLCPEASMPYRLQFDASQPPTPEARADGKTRATLGLRMDWIKRWDVKTGLTEAEFEGIRQTLDRGWPVCGGFRWPKKAQWKDGVLQMCGAEDVFDGHSILLVGWRADASLPGSGAFLFRNTSGPGPNGQMPYAYARLYMNDAAVVLSDPAPAPAPGAATP